MLDLVIGLVLLAIGGWCLVKAFQRSPRLKARDEHDEKNSTDESSSPSNHSSNGPGI
ncbi:hypothetical protein [Metabacillus iocasae]|uniref:Uncharacterized protein n=1 Tax=Priestia iocasae TaxID=2291674 RepID=A0ABS2QTM7_9BACI|nr:hypothetical protein [Metabacillus iocasae]MBM7702834.1 hypothetical protein [Metabacillus iocasae]